MTDRELMQRVLDALNTFDNGNHGMKWQVPLIKALRARLSQPNDFNPDWDAMAVMVEEQQRMAKRIEELTQLVTSQGIRLMDAEAQPEPAECDGGKCGIGGYCTQCPKTQPDVPETTFGETKPVAWKMKGVPAFATSRPNDTDSIKWEPLYTAPPQREWVGLTDEEIVVRANAEVFAEAFARGVAWAELKLKEKNT